MHRKEDLRCRCDYVGDFSKVIARVIAIVHAKIDIDCKIRYELHCGAVPGGSLIVAKIVGINRLAHRESSQE